MRYTSLFWLACALGLSGCTQTSETETPEAATAPRQERHISLEGQPNFRDLGGYETADGRTVKWGEVYRSGALPLLSDADVARLDELELATVVNFLLPEEIERKGPDRLPEGTEELHRPISGDQAARQTMMVTDAIKTAEFDKVPPEINPEFHRLLMDEGRDVYAELLRDAIDPTNRPMAFHCSHGIHRTGTATAILLSALGVPWETVREDYLLSNVYRKEEVERELERIRQGAAKKLGVPPKEVDMTNIEAFYILDGSYIDGALEWAVGEYGSMEGYLSEGLGLTDQDIAALRAELLE